MRTATLFFLLISPLFLYPQQPSTKSSFSETVWQNVGMPGFSAGASYYTSLAFSPVTDQPYVAYVDVPWGPVNTGPGTVMKFNGTQWENVGVPGFTGVTIGYTSLAFSPVDHLPYVAFAAGCSSTLQASVMRFDGDNWTYVGNGGFSPGTAAFTSLAFNPVNGKPYVAFMDMINSNKVSVMKFDDAQWIYVGSPNFSQGEGMYSKIDFSPAGIPYVVYQDFANTLDVTVMKFDGINWVNVGSAGFVTGVTDEAGFGVSPLDGQPYVAVDDAANLHQIKVMKFDGSDWVTVGDIGSTQGWASRMGVTFSPSGRLFVSFWDSSIPGMCVKTFDGANWNTIGNTGFSAGYLDYPSFHLSPYGTPCLAYMDETDSNKATVMTYDFPIGINDLQTPYFRLYPNPATDYITIEFKKTDISLKNIEVYDITGKLMAASLTSNDKMTILTEYLPGGIYIIKVKTESSVYVSRFCKDF